MALEQQTVLTTTAQVVETVTVNNGPIQVFVHRTRTIMLNLLMKWLQGRLTNLSQLNIFLSEAVELVKEMINQVAELHMGIQWFHVGADEVGNEPCEPHLSLFVFQQKEVEIIVLLFIQNNS